LTNGLERGLSKAKARPMNCGSTNDWSGYNLKLGYQCELFVKDFDEIPKNNG
jgi:hypothetical protein